MNISISIVSLFCIVFTLLYFVCIFVCCILCVINDDDFPADFLPRTVCGKCLTQYVVTLTWQPVTHLQPWILWVDSNPKPCRKLLEFRLSALMDSDLAWVNGKSGRQRWRYHADAFQRSIISEAIYHFILPFMFVLHWCDWQSVVLYRLTDLLARVWLVRDFQFGYVALYRFCYLVRRETHGMNVVRSKSQWVVGRHEVLRHRSQTVIDVHHRQTSVGA